MSFNFCQRLLWCYLNTFIAFQRLENSMRLILHKNSRNLRNLALSLNSSTDHSLLFPSRITRAWLKQTVILKLRTIWMLKRKKKHVLFSTYTRHFIDTFSCYFRLSFCVFLLFSSLERCSVRLHYFPYCRQHLFVNSVSLKTEIHKIKNIYKLLWKLLFKVDWK